MNQQSGHLNDAQVAQYGNTVRPGQPEADGRDHEIEVHLADCDVCRERVLSAQRIRFTFLAVPEMSSGPNARRPGSANPGGLAPGPNCPDEDDLRSLAAGLFPPDQASKLVQHAAQCDHCGPLLRSYVADFSDEASDEDQAWLAKLKSSSANWQKKVVADLRASSGRSTAKPEKKRFPWRWVWAPAALAACVAIAFAVWYQQRETPEKVEKLLAEAYTEQRTMEMRFPDSAWAPVRMTRGPEDSRFLKPAKLLEAEDIISRRQAADPTNVEWLRSKAEADLLEEHPESAAAILEGALAAQPQSDTLMLDLASAYFMQAQGSSPQGYAKTIDLLSKIVKRNPSNPEALFNLALTYARSEMWDQAAVTWRMYLRLDSRSPWADEARKKLDEAESKIHSELSRPTDTPADASSFLTLSDDVAEFNSEHYLDVAVQNWLVHATVDPKSTDYQATSRLARLVSQRHSDPWLQDFLSRTGTHDPSGVLALSAANMANSKGHYAEAFKKSRQAENIFRQRRNLPGELRARYESVYATQRFLRGTACLARADPLEKATAQTTYHWLQSQIALERAICLNFVGRLSHADEELSSSFETAKRFHFPILALRDIGISQSLDIQRGKYAAAWDSGIRGLRNYWSGPSSLARMYQFYVSLAISAERMGLWSAAEALQRHAVGILEREDDQVQLGTARLELANILMAEGADSSAENELAEANRLFDREKAEPTSRSYRLTARIGLADLQLKHADAKAALSTLEPAHELLSATDGYFVSLHYYRLLGSIERQLKQTRKAKEAYMTAIVIAERSLGEVKDNRDRLPWIQGADEAYRGLVRVLLEENDDADALSLWEWYRSRPFQQGSIAAKGDHEVRAADWSGIWAAVKARRIDHGHSPRVVYAVFDDEIQIWVTTQGRLKAARVAANREQLERMVRQFSRGCSRPDSPVSTIQKQGQDLFRLLLQPVIDDLPVGSPVSVELDRSLSGLPIEALRSPNGWYLAEQYPLVYSPGTIREKQIRDPKRVDASQSFLLADASAGRGGIYLPGSGLERETISRLFPKTKIIASDANLGLAQSLLAQSDIFAFIGHGEPNGSGTALRLNSVVLLRAEDLPPHILRRLRLAVLAACSTGSGGENGLLDNRNLVHAFLVGGVPSVIASNWAVDSETTADLVSLFYADVAAGKPAPLALFIARKRVLRGHIHPYFWAGLSFIGKAS